MHRVTTKIEYSVLLWKNQMVIWYKKWETNARR